MLDSLTLLRAMNGIHEEDVVMAGNSYFGRRKNTYHRTKRIVTLALAAALVLALGAVAYGATAWYSETRSLEESTELRQGADRGAEDLQRFLGGGIFVADGDAIYENGDKGQSDTTTFFYNDWTYSISYYGSGEIQILDAASSFQLDCPANKPLVQYLEERYPDAAGYKAEVEAAAPAILDALHEGGWIQGDSSEIERVYCNERNRFNDKCAICSVLMTDGSAYELKLQPDTLEVKGFLYWKPEDALNARNGLFVALHEGTEEEWWQQLQTGGLG